jgi:HEPN domain-containing protein
MTNPRMSRFYIEEARGRTELVRLALERRLWATVVREAQECVELFLKGALRCVAVEPARTHDVAEILRRENNRFPGWFRPHVERLAAISAEMAADRGLAFYGDERQEVGPQELFDESDARRCIAEMELVEGLCTRLVDELPSDPRPEGPGGE